MADLQKSEERKTLQVFDLELNDFVQVTPAEQELALRVHNKILMGTFICAMGIQKMFDEKLYLGLGFSSREEYIENSPISRRQAYRYYAIASKFAPLLSDIEQKVPTLALSDNESQMQLTENAESLQGLGIAKLYELTKVDDDELESLAKNGSMKLGDETVTVEDLNEMKLKEMVQKLSEVKGKFNSKIQQLSEEVKMLKAEGKNTSAATVDDEKIKNAQALELKYGAVATKLADKEYLINQARKALNDFEVYLNNSNVEIDDPKGLQEDLLDLIRKADEIHNRAQVRFGELII